MNEFRIEFDEKKGNERFNCYKEKIIIKEHTQFRLVEFKKGFVSPNYCNLGHSGIVLEGTFKIDLNGHWETFEKGEAFYLPAGDATAHRVHQELGGDAKVLFFENV